jgi:hypothetical protein
VATVRAMGSVMKVVAARVAGKARAALAKGEAVVRAVEYRVAEREEEQEGAGAPVEAIVAEATMADLMAPVLVVMAAMVWVMDAASAVVDAAVALAGVATGRAAPCQEACKMECRRRRPASWSIEHRQV